VSSKQRPANSRKRPVTGHKITTVLLREMKARHETIAALTAYDYPTAAILDAAGIELILVGDSAANVVYGHTTTLRIGMPEMLFHTRAVAAAVKSALVVADMPFLSYQVSPAAAVANAGAFLKAGAEAVKVEGGEPMLKTIERIVKLGIPVMGHLGLTPQSVHQLGGYRLQATGAEGHERLLADARGLEAAGCFAIVLEKVPAGIARETSASLKIPTIGIGAGPGCDGQILVLHDILGIFERRFRFARRYAELGGLIADAAKAYRADVRAHRFPGPDNTYTE
jgi:3-methyl-2-oxobutanoate hydroxymethyltransferase